MHAITTPTPTALAMGQAIAPTWSGWTSSQERPEGHHLEAVRDLLRTRRQAEAPLDLERSPSQAPLRFGEGEPARLQFLFRDGMGEPMTLTRTALTQLARTVLPSRGLGVIEGLCRNGGQPDPVGVRQASATWAIFALRRSKPLMFRTVERDGARVVRATLSQGYQTYDSLELVEDVLAALGSDADLYNVVDHRITDDHLRVRLVGGSQEGLEAWRSKAVNVPHPMVSLWNGETGNSAVYVRSGTFTLWCSNGCGHWGGQGQWRWNHTGRTSERIRQGVASAIEEAAVQSRGIVDAYAQAVETSIDDPLAWYLEAARGRTSDRQNAAVEVAMREEPTVQAHRGLLAEVVDAVTWAAQREIDLHSQDRMERLAGQLLDQGLRTRDDSHRLWARAPLA